jgi:hypothetical protein
MACGWFIGTPAGGFKLCGVGNKLADFPRLLTFVSSFYRVPRNDFPHFQEPGDNTSPLGPETQCGCTLARRILLGRRSIVLVKWCSSTVKAYLSWRTMKKCDELPACDGSRKIYLVKLNQGGPRASQAVV